MDDKSLSRRNAIKNLGLGGVALVASGTILAGTNVFNEEVVEASSRTNSMGVTDVDILNFALNLEYLEAEFYAYTTTGSGIPDKYLNGVGKEGSTTGGTQTVFSDQTLQTVAIDIADDEFQHVIYLRKALGSKAVGKPTIKLDPLGSTATENAFLTYARAFEDTGVSAYGAAATLIRSSAVLGVAARILATEAYHAGNIRLFAIQKGLTLSALDKKDVPPTATTVFTTNSQGLAIVRSVKEVLKIVGPFFPDGLNGKIK